MKKFYAVQVGNDYACDNGSTNKREALRVAKQEARENPGKEVRIAVCTVDDDFVTSEIIVQEAK